MTIREAIDAIVAHGRPARHSERAQGCVAVDRTFARESGVLAEWWVRWHLARCHSVARSMGGAAP